LRNILVVMVKEPHPGWVKTRLGAGMGMVGAAWWYRHQVARLLREVSDARWEVVLAVSPDGEGLGSRVWPSAFGSDIPGIRRHHIARGFAALGAHDAVLGPSEDGGYWLVGIKSWRAPAKLFEGVRWSTEHALADTERGLAGLRIARVDTLRDVDTVDDL